MKKFIKIIKKIKIRNIIILIVLILFNSYAWFIYATRVDTEISAHISSWNVKFVSADEELTTNLTIQIARIYPGMERFEKIIEVQNKGETRAELGYDIKELKIMDETFVVNEKDGPTTQEIVNKIESEYPFKIKIEKNDEQLKNATGNGRFIISLEWNFESGDDEADTNWGNRAYEFYALHPEENSIEIKLELKAIQKAE